MLKKFLQTQIIDNLMKRNQTSSQALSSQKLKVKSKSKKKHRRAFSTMNVHQANPVNPAGFAWLITNGTGVALQGLPIQLHSLQGSMMQNQQFNPPPAISENNLSSIQSQSTDQIYKLINTPIPQLPDRSLASAILERMETQSRTIDGAGKESVESLGQGQKGKSRRPPRVKTQTKEQLRKLVAEADGQSDLQMIIQQKRLSPQKRLNISRENSLNKERQSEQGKSSEKASSRKSSPSTPKSSPSVEGPTIITQPKPITSQVRRLKYKARSQSYIPGFQQIKEEQKNPDNNSDTSDCCRIENPGNMQTQQQLKRHHTVKCQYYKQNTQNSKQTSNNPKVRTTNSYSNKQPSSGETPLLISPQRKDRNGVRFELQSQLIMKSDSMNEVRKDNNKTTPSKFEVNSLQNRNNALKIQQVSVGAVNLSSNNTPRTNTGMVSILETPLSVMNANNHQNGTPQIEEESKKSGENQMIGGRSEYQQRSEKREEEEEEEDIQRADTISNINQQLQGFQKFQTLIMDSQNQKEIETSSYFNRSITNMVGIKQYEMQYNIPQQIIEQAECSSEDEPLNKATMSTIEAIQHYNHFSQKGFVQDTVGRIGHQQDEIWSAKFGGYSAKNAPSINDNIALVDAIKEKYNQFESVDELEDWYPSTNFLEEQIQAFSSVRSKITFTTESALPAETLVESMLQEFPVESRQDLFVMADDVKLTPASMDLQKHFKVMLQEEGKVFFQLQSKISLQIELNRHAKSYSLQECLTEQQVNLLRLHKEGNEALIAQVNQIPTLALLKGRKKPVRGRKASFMQANTRMSIKSPGLKPVKKHSFILSKKDSFEFSGAVKRKIDHQKEHTGVWGNTLNIKLVDAETPKNRDSIGMLSVSKSGVRRSLRQSQLLTPDRVSEMDFSASGLLEDDFYQGSEMESEGSADQADVLYIASKAQLDEREETLLSMKAYLDRKLPKFKRIRKKMLNDEEVPDINSKIIEYLSLDRKHFVFLKAKAEELIFDVSHDSLKQLAFKPLKHNHAHLQPHQKPFYNTLMKTFFDTDPAEYIDIGLLDVFTKGNLVKCTGKIGIMYLHRLQVLNCQPTTMAIFRSYQSNNYNLFLKKLQQGRPKNRMASHAVLTLKTVNTVVPEFMNSQIQKVLCEQQLMQKKIFDNYRTEESGVQSILPTLAAISDRIFKPQKHQLRRLVKAEFASLLPNLVIQVLKDQFLKTNEYIVQKLHKNDQKYMKIKTYKLMKEWTSPLESDRSNDPDPNETTVGLSDILGVQARYQMFRPLVFIKYKACSSCNMKQFLLCEKFGYLETVTVDGLMTCFVAYSDKYVQAFIFKSQIKKQSTLYKMEMKRAILKRHSISELDQQKKYSLLNKSKREVLAKPPQNLQSSGVLPTFMFRTQQPEALIKTKTKTDFVISSLLQLPTLHDLESNGHSSAREPPTEDDHMSCNSSISSESMKSIEEESSAPEQIIPSPLRRQNTPRMNVLDRPKRSSMAKNIKSHLFELQPVCEDSAEDSDISMDNDQLYRFQSNPVHIRHHLALDMILMENQLQNQNQLIVPSLQSKHRKSAAIKNKKNMMKRVSLMTVSSIKMKNLFSGIPKKSKKKMEVSDSTTVFSDCELEKRPVEFYDIKVHSNYSQMRAQASLKMKLHSAHAMVKQIQGEHEVDGLLHLMLERKEMLKQKKQMKPVHNEPQQDLAATIEYLVFHPVVIEANHDQFICHSNLNVDDIEMVMHSLPEYKILKYYIPYDLQCPNTAQTIRMLFQAKLDDHLLENLTVHKHSSLLEQQETCSRCSDIFQMRRNSLVYRPDPEKAFAPCTHLLEVSAFDIRATQFDEPVTPKLPQKHYSTKERAKINDITNWFNNLKFAQSETASQEIKAEHQSLLKQWQKQNFDKINNNLKEKKKQILAQFMKEKKVKLEWEKIKENWSDKTIQTLKDLYLHSECPFATNLEGVERFRHYANVLMRQLKNLRKLRQFSSIATQATATATKKASRTLEKGKLLKAIQMNQKAIIQEFVNANSSMVDLQDTNGYTLLFYATYQGRVEIVDILLRNGANPNIPTFNTMNTPLHIAVQKGFKQIIQLLIEAGANEKQLNKHKLAPWEATKFYTQQQN